MERLGYMPERQESRQVKLESTSAKWGNILERTVTPLAMLANIWVRTAIAEQERLVSSVGT